MKRKPETRGRPRKPAASKRTAAYQLRLTIGERERIDAAAAQAGLCVADYIRRRLE